ncbi:MAG: OsmC family protein [Longimicrobiales bacterium]
MAEAEKEFDLMLRRLEGFKFDTEFDGEKMANLMFDEPDPIGDDEGPNAARVLSAAVGNCLSASLLFCLQKARVTVEDMTTDVHGVVTRNEDKRLRVTAIKVRINATIPPEDQDRVPRCLKVFEDFCVVSGSVRKGIDIDVEVDVLNPSS